MIHVPPVSVGSTMAAPGAGLGLHGVGIYGLPPGHHPAPGSPVSAAHTLHHQAAHLLTSAHLIANSPSAQDHLLQQHHQKHFLYPASPQHQNQHQQLLQPPQHQQHQTSFMIADILGKTSTPATNRDTNENATSRVELGRGARIATSPHSPPPPVPRSESDRERHSLKERRISGEHSPGGGHHTPYPPHPPPPPSSRDSPLSSSRGTLSPPGDLAHSPARPTPVHHPAALTGTAALTTPAVYAHKPASYYDHSLGVLAAGGYLGTGAMHGLPASYTGGLPGALYSLPYVRPEYAFLDQRHAAYTKSEC